jgi:hypothetical protein
MSTHVGICWYMLVSEYFGSFLAKVRRQGKSPIPAKIEQKLSIGHAYCDRTVKKAQISLRTSTIFV